MLKALAAFAAISVNGQLNALSTPAPCCSDAVQCEEYAKLCLSGNRYYCSILPCTSSTPSVVVDSCNPCPQGGSLVNGKCIDTLPATADGMCPPGYAFNPLTRVCEMSYPAVQFFTDCPSASPSPVQEIEHPSPSSTPNKCCNDATDECMILARLCASGDLTACGFVPCAPSPSPVDYAPSPYPTVPSLCFNPCTKGGIPYAYDSRTKTISCRIVTDAINGTCNSNYVLHSDNTCVHEYTTLYSPQSCSPSPSPSFVNTRESSSMTPKVEPSSSASMTLKVVPSSSASNTPKVVPSRSASNTPKVVQQDVSPSSVVINRESATPSMTPKVVDTIVVERTQSPSMTPKVVDRESATPSMTPKIIERTASPSVRPSNVDVLDYTNRPVEPLYTRKPDCNIWVCPPEYEVTNLNGKVVCKYYKLADYNVIALPSDPEGNVGYYNEYYCPTGIKLVVIKDAVESEKYWCEAYTDAIWTACPSVSSTPKVDRSSTRTPSMTAKVQQDTYSASPSTTLRMVPSSSPSNTPKEIVNRESSSPSMTPKVQQDDTYSSTPSNTPCGDWVCPIDLEFVYKLISTAESRVPICFYETDAEYEIVDYPDTPEGQSGGSTIRYWCKDRRFTLDGSKCVIKAEAEYIACPSVSSTPSMTYKKQIDASRSSVPSSTPDRSPIVDAAITVAFPSRRVSPPMSPRPSPKFSRFPWFTPVMTKKPLFGTSITGALTFPQASITTIDKLKELQVHLACMFHVDVEKVSITSIVRYINGTKYSVPIDISKLSSLEVPLIGCYKIDTPVPALARMLQSVNGDVVVDYAMTDSTAEILTVDPTVVQAAIASDPAIIDFASSVGSGHVDASANAANAPSGDGITTSNTGSNNFGAVTGIAVVFGAILAVVGVVGGAKYAQHRKRVAKNSKVIKFDEEGSPRRNPLTYDATKQMFTPTPTVNYIV
jgi:hypothetical protein